MIQLPKTWPERSAAAVLALLWIICVWRAATQSIVHDEALTYQLYLATPFSSIFQVFDANHHFLNTLLMRLSTSIFGFSGLAMRLPALFGAAIFFLALYRFCRWALGASWMMTIAIALTALNPFVLDFMVAARGYGLALAFWMAAIALIAPQLGSLARERKPVLLAGTCAALSVTANMIFIPPVAMLALIVVWYSLRPSQPVEPAPQKKRKADAKSPAARGLWFDFFLPAAIIAIVFLLSAPLEKAEGQDFYTGAPTIHESLQSLADSSLAHGGPSAYQAFAKKSADPAVLILAPLFLLAGLAAGIRSKNLPLIVVGVTACGSAILVALLHLALNFPYPADRTGIYFIALVTLSIGLAASLPHPAIQKSAAAVALVLIACFAIQFDTRFFYVWSYDAETDQIAAKLADLARQKPAANFNVSWRLEPALNFYRETRHYDQLSPFHRLPLGPGYDFYALSSPDGEQNWVRELGLTILYRGPVSATVIAAPAIH